jgi:predicted LPLAT superfamily acyltransferase
MIAVFAMKTGTYKYHFITKEVGDAQQFADVLENVVRQYPLQWFNYFDFWNEQ